MRWVWLLLLVTCVWGKSLQSEWSSAKKEYSKARSKALSTQNKLAKLAKDIKRENQRVAKLEKELIELEYEAIEANNTLRNLTLDLGEANRSFQNADKRLAIKKEEFSQLVTQQLSLSLMQRQLHLETRESFLTKEVFEGYSRYAKRAMELLRDEIILLRKTKSKSKDKITLLKEKIASIGKKMRRYKEQKRKSKELSKHLEEQEDALEKALIAMLERKKSLYDAYRDIDKKYQKKKLEQKQASIRRLRELKRKKREKQLQQMRAEAKLRHAKDTATKKRAKAQLAKANRELAAIKEEKVKIRIVGSSYKRPSITHYRGKKYAAPLKNSYVVLSFGESELPGYSGFKNFNRDLRIASRSGSKDVHAVFGGVVVYANRGFYGTTVVIKKGNLYATYSPLRSLSSRVKKGSVVREGSYIGKVAKTLMIETKIGKRLFNPRELFRI